MAVCLFCAHVKVQFSVLHVHLKDKLLHVFSMNDKSHMVSFSYCPFLLSMCSDPRFNSTVLVSTCKPQEITQPHCPQHKSCKCSFLFFLIKCYTGVPEFTARALFHHVCVCVCVCVCIQCVMVFLLLIAFIQRFSLHSSRLDVLLSYVILNE